MSKANDRLSRLLAAAQVSDPFEPTPLSARAEAAVLRAWRLTERAAPVAFFERLLRPCLATAFAVMLLTLGWSAFDPSDSSLTQSTSLEESLTDPSALLASDS